MKAPFGWLKFQLTDSRLVGIELQPPHGYSGAETILDMPALKTVVSQFWDYFDEPTRRFSIPESIFGTPFQQRVWLELSRIPSGVTVTYGRLAADLGSSGIRSVAAACKANPFPIIVPCHRVVAATGIGGYCGHKSGPMVGIKQWLLQHEGHTPWLL